MIEIKSKKDLEKLIKNKVTENLNLEYKSAPALSNDEKKKLDISKFVSSMANSAGGVIIYGMKEFDNPDLKHLPERIDEINGKEFSKEWLEQIINSSIRPKISGITIKPIYTNALKNKVTYVINIPQSETAHQAKDHIYYKRYNFTSVPMEDYEIRDIMNRSKESKLILKYEIKTGSHHGMKRACRINLFLYNQGKASARAPFFAFKCDSLFPISGLFFGEKSLCTRWNIPRDSEGYSTCEASNDIIIHPYIHLRVAIIEFEVNENSPLGKDLIINFKVCAENMSFEQKDLVILATEINKKVLGHL